MISHELRTPLATIQLATDLLKDYNDRLSEEARSQHLGKIQAQVKHLTTLLEDALMYTKAEQVGLQLQLRPVDLRTFCAELCAELRATHPNREIVCTASSEDWSVLVDPKLLRQAVMNLLSNAVKYSEEDSTVKLTLVREDKDAVISVVDQGMGISDSDLPHIFEVFYRATNVGTIPGTGLGLPLVRQIAEAHHGFVFCETKLGVGTTFTLRIPVFS
jgi:signal transduction histidine kinase